MSDRPTPGHGQKKDLGYGQPPAAGACGPSPDVDDSVGGVRPPAVTDGQGADSSPGPEPSPKQVLAAALRGSRDKQEELAVMAFFAALGLGAAPPPRGAARESSDVDARLRKGEKVWFGPKPGNRWEGAIVMEDEKPALVAIRYTIDGKEVSVSRDTLRRFAPKSAAPPEPEPKAKAISQDAQRSVRDVIGEGER